MAEKTVFVKVGAKVDGAVAGLRKVRASVDDLTKAAAPKKADAFGAIADKAALMGVAVAGGIGVAVKRFADFDKAMSAVQANSGETGTSLEQLREAAIELGADTIFSATEAAEGINELAKAGVGAQDVLGGGLKGALDLAAAGQIGVAEAAETAATAMTQFNLQGTDIPHVADLLTNAANKAQGGVSDLAQALKQGGLVAASTGLTIDETTGSLAAFASAGLIGSDAGTSLKTMLQRLSAPSKEAAQLMGELGISAYDANGQFVGMQAVAGQLTEAFKDKTDAERNSAMATIFGSDAVRAANILYNEGAAGIAKWNKEVGEQGAAARQAAILTDNLSGDIERLGGAFDSAFIQAGGAANSSLRTLVQGLTGVVDHVGKIPGPILLAGGALTSLALLAPKGIIMWRNYAKQLDTLGISFDRLNKKAPRTASALRGVGRAAGLLGVAATAVYAFGDAADSLNVEKLSVDLAGTSDGLKLINKELAASTNNGWGRVGSDIDSFGKALGAAFDPGVINSVDNAIGSFKTIFGAENVSNIANATKQLDGIDKALAQLVASGNARQAADIFAQMTKVAQEQGVSVEDLERKFPGYAAAVANAGTQAATAASDTGLMTTETDALEQAASDAEQALSDLQDAILGLGSEEARQRQATRDYQSAIDDAAASVKEHGKALDVGTEAGRANQAALDQIAAAALEKAAADFAATESTKGVDAATKTASETLKQGRKDFINAAIAAGMTRDEANDLADKLGLIPENVDIAVKQTGAKEAGEAIDAAARARTATITVVTKDGGSYRYTPAGGRTPQFGGGFTEKATGGPIYGPGTGTSDTAGVFALSNGEHVLTAAEVEKAGGHGAIFALRKAILTGGIQFRAAGGPAEQFAPRQPFAAGVSFDPARIADAFAAAGHTFNISGPDPATIVRMVMDQLNWKVASGG